LDVLAILKLADDLESSSDGSHADDGDDGKAAAHVAYSHRRTTLISHTRRVALLHKLKALAASSALDEIAQMVTTTVQVAQEQQAKQLRRSRHGKQPARDGNANGDNELSSASFSSSSSEDDDGADDVRKMAQKAKTRRVAKVKARSASTSYGNGDANEDDTSGDEAPASGGRRDVLLSLRHASGSKGIKLFNVGILLRLIYQVQAKTSESVPPSALTLTLVCLCLSMCVCVWPDLPRTLREHGVIAPVRQPPYGV
jgi:hypothetical protein